MSAPLSLSIKCSTGTKFQVEVEDTSSTVAEFKELLAPQADVPAAQQRLIYKGHVLRDAQTLEDCDVQNDHTIHLVRGAPPPGQAEPPAASSIAGSAPAVNPSSQPAGAANPFSQMLGANPFGGGAPPSMQQMRQQMMSDPNMMREMMDSPMMQSLMQNPDLIRSVISSNPQMRQVMESNPELNHVLNDPTILQQALNVARNPSLMQEMMRSQDRQMSNIEGHPEGFNALRRMYENVQQPMMDAEFGGSPAAAPGPDAAAPSTTPNADPLPNPWGPSPDQGAGAGQAPPAPAANPFAAFAPPGAGGAAGAASNPFAALFGGAAAPPSSAGASAGTAPSPGNPFAGANPFGSMGLDPTMMQDMLQRPEVQSAMQQMMSNPELLQGMMQSNPMLQQMMEANPGARQLMSDPAALRAMMDPQNMQAMLQMRQAMEQLNGSGLFGGAPALQQLLGSGAAAAPGAPAAGATGMLNPAAAAMPPEQLYAQQAQALVDMGFTDAAANLRGLVATHGNVDAAIDRLLQGL